MQSATKLSKRVARNSDSASVNSLSLCVRLLKELESEKKNGDRQIILHACYFTKLKVKSGSPVLISKNGEEICEIGLIKYNALRNSSGNEGTFGNSKSANVKSSCLYISMASKFRSF